MAFSRHYLTDLQVHSPADPEQGYGSWTGREDEVVRRIVEAHLDAGVEVIALTDHVDISWYPRFSNQAEAVAAETGRRLYVFPGFEVSANGCHLILIWDRTDTGYETARRHLEGLYPAHVERRVGNEFRPVNEHPEAVARAAVETGAIVVAPHATKKKMGAFASGVVSNVGDLVASNLVSAWDVHGDPRNGILTGPRLHFGDRVPAWICTGDTRSCDDAGQRAVWLKTDSPPTLNGLRHAFVAPSTRIRFPEHLRAKYGDVKHVRYAESVKPTCARITRVTVEGGFHGGLDLTLAPGLNAIIGGRGTGKSALIEIIRYGLGLDDPDVSRLVENRQRNLPASAEVTVEFVTAEGVTYRSHRPGGDLEPPTVFRDDGTEADIAATDRLHPHVFGQTQLQELVATENLREFLVRQAAERWRPLASAEAIRSRNLIGVSGSMSAIESATETLEDQEAELRDLRDRLKNAESHHAADKIAELERLATTEQAVDEVIGWPDQVEIGLVALRDKNEPPDLPDHPNVPDDVAAATRLLSDAVAAAADDVAAVLAEARERLSSASDTWDDWVTQARTTLSAELSGLGIERPEQLAADQRRAARLKSDVETLRKSADELVGLQSDWDENLRQLRMVRRGRSRLLAEIGDDLNERLGSTIRLHVEPMADLGPLEDALFEATKGVNRATLQRAAAEAKHPQRLVEALRKARKPPADGSSDVLDGTRQLTDFGLTSTAIEQLRALPESAVRDLEMVDVPDIVRLKMNLGTPTEPVWQDVEAMSPGQAATALLALVMVGGSEPLIVDQPEEDLDNRFVFNEVVSQLTDTCARRQVIVVTHDANIPVVGDAELIVALDAEAHKASVLACGGLENPDVARHARDILEGGQEAFDERMRRYPPA